MAERGRPEVRKPLDHLARETRNPREDETLRDRSRLLAALTLDRDLLPFEIALIPELGFNAGDVDCRLIRNGIQG